jgi:S-adenosylhomocysteine hydrolase
MMGDYRVADISLADFGRKEIQLAEVEVSGRLDAAGGLTYDPTMAALMH